MIGYNDNVWVLHKEIMCIKLWTIMKAITWREVENTSVEGTNFENELSN